MTAVRSGPRTRAFARPGGEGARIVTKLGEVDLADRVITNSARGTFQSCRRKFQYAYGHRLATRGIQDYFWIGGAVHGELDLMYASGKFVAKECRKRIDKATREALALCATDHQRDKLWVASANAQGLLPVYAGRFLEQDLERFDVLATEASFSIPIPGTDWKYAGKRDMVARVRKGDRAYSKGEVGLWEHKTTAQADANYFARLPLDFQILGYVWSMRQDEDHADPSFIQYNVIQKTRLRQKQGESFGQLLDRIEADYQADPTKYFYREKVDFDDRAIDAFEAELVKFVKYDLEPAIKRGYFSMNSNHCTARGTCEFLRLCIEGPSSDALLEYRRKESAHEELGEPE